MSDLVKLDTEFWKEIAEKLGDIRINAYYKPDELVWFVSARRENDVRVIKYSYDMVKTGGIEGISSDILRIFDEK